VSVAGLRFGSSRVSPVVIDELCSLFVWSSSEHFEFRDCEFFLPTNEQTQLAATALTYAPLRLLDYVNETLRTSIVKAGRSGSYPLRAYLQLNVGPVDPDVS
jgi:hypothetical protein